MLLQDILTLLNKLNEVFPTVQPETHKITSSNLELKINVLAENKWFNFIFEDVDLIGNELNIDDIVNEFTTYINDWKVNNGN